MPKFKIEKDVLTIEEGEDSLVSKMIAGCQGTVTIKSPFIKGGKQVVKSVKDKNGKEIKKKGV